MLDSPVRTREVVHALRRARRQHRLEDVDWVDVLYKVYVSAIASLAALFTAAAFVGDTRLSPSGIDDVRTGGPPWIGLAVAIALALALRSGARGGPLALEAPDVSHVLLAPVDRATVLRGVAYRQLRGVLLGGLVAGILAGDLAAQRLSGGSAADVVGWLATGAGFGLAVTLGSWGAALVASGRHLSRTRAGVVGGALVVWAAVDVAVSGTTSPMTWLGRLALAPLDLSAFAFTGAVLVLALPVVGLVGIGGTSIEATERRAGLVGQLRFAATVQDLRAVVVLHRQLAHEQSRDRPWVSLRAPGSRIAPGAAPWRRGWQGVLRWPLTRTGRVLALGAIAGAASVGVWRGTTPLVVVAGLALTLAALDAIEPLAQETDHPDRLASVPVPRSAVHARLLSVPLCVMLLAGCAGLVVALAFEPHLSTLGLGGAIVVTAALAATAGVALQVVLGAPRFGTNLQMSFPEMATIGLILRQAFPAMLTAAAVAPVIAARELVSEGKPALGTAVSICVPVVVIAVGIVVWIDQRRIA